MAQRLASLAFTAVGAISVGSASLAFPWKVFDGDGVYFSDRNLLTDALGLAPLSNAYFTWLGPALLALVATLGILATLPGQGGAALSVPGTALSAMSVAVTVVALKGDNTWASVSRDAGSGFWLANFGFLVMTFGCALAGPPAVSDPTIDHEPMG